MRISLDEFSFEVPADFEDRTVYTFRDRPKREELMISFGIRPPEATSLQKLMELRLGNLEIVAPGATKVGPQSDTRIDGLPGRMVTFTLKDKGVEYLGRWAVAFLTPNEYVHISSTAPVSGGMTDERFQHLLLSVVLALENSKEPTPPGFIRRWARRMTLDVPATLLPPRRYTFAALDRSANLLLATSDPRDPTTVLPRIAEEIALDTGSGATAGEQFQHAITAGHAQAALTSYELTTDDLPDPTKEFVCRSHVVIQGGPAIHVCARVKNGTREQADRLVENFIRGLQPLD